MVPGPAVAEEGRGHAGCTQPADIVMPWLRSLLNLDGPGHMRVQRTKILIVAGRGEGERKTVVGIHRLRPELARRDDGVRNVVVVLPGHGGAGLQRGRLRLKGEIAD